MKTSIVRRALIEFEKGNYNLALQLYEEAAKKLGRKLFHANIEICKRRLINFNESRISQSVAEANIFQPIWLTNSPVWHRFEVSAGKLIQVQAIVRANNAGNKSAVALVRFLDDKNNPIDAQQVAMPRSDIFGTNFVYLLDSAAKQKKLFQVKSPQTANILEVGFCLFTKDKETSVQVSDLELKTVVEVIENIKEKSHESYKKPTDLKVALIADEFTFNSFKDEFIAIQIEPGNWRQKFDENKPDIFFCESAWSGIDSVRRPWKGRVYASKNFSKENRSDLLDIIAYCRKEGIPTVFWNKEDPTHHSDRVHDFVKTAKEFDFVFTTAAECVDSYKSVYGVKHAFALPFATNPRLFNPIEVGARSSKVVFAGSWYANHAQRSIDMEQIMDRIVKDGFEIEIFDRYYGELDPMHKWPTKYHDFLLPSRPHDQMPNAYKASRFGLNFNTVTNSPTMFARRVFELMSSNTLVISNYSRGTDEMFGDLIVYPDKEPDRLRALSAVEIEQLRSRALHKVLTEHTYAHRWRTMLDSIGMSYLRQDITLTFVSIVRQRTDALSAISWFQQHGASINDAKLLLVANESMAELDVAALYKEFNRFGVTVSSYSHASRYAMMDRYQPIETSHFVTFSDSKRPDQISLKNALPHLQYMRDLPIALSNSFKDKYQSAPVSVEVPLIDAANRFNSWLKRDCPGHNAYFV